MPSFKYIARTQKGEKVEGVLEAHDRRAVVLQLGKMGYLPVAVNEAKAAAVDAKNKAEKKGQRWQLPTLTLSKNRQPHMKMRDVLLFTGELSDLLAAGMTLGHALNTLAQRKSGTDQDKIVGELRDAIVQGASLSEALGKWPKTFSSLYISMVKAGEASGTLPEVLERLRLHYDRVQEAKEKVIMALVYPAIIMIMGGLTMIFTLVFVVPRFTAIFKELGSTLPLPTRILIGTSNVLAHYGWAIAILIAVGVFYFKRFIKTKKGLMWWDRFKLRMPVVRNIVAANSYAHFARTLGALLANGVPVLNAMSIVENTVGNAVIAKELHDARERVTDGSTLSKPLAASKIFPRLLTDMLAVGEESGDISGALKHIANRYDHELDRSVKILTTVMEPVLIVSMAMLVGFVAISMLVAVFDLTSGLNV